ncbi:MAG: FxsA family protein [Candidatus Bipolaricaulota bacterium]|nr:FxsA family protein [Candidatus Bipolaricaulota bacterium]MBS3791264.1 FxsA family protein [Candidatus Bipolaricaulota bacterium]
MSLRLIFLFTALPLIEIYLLIRVGNAIGYFLTALLVVGTGLVGALLARREGISVLRRMRKKFREGRMPAEELIDGVILLLSGAFLLTPGIVTDVIGLAGLIPFFRRGVRGYGRRWFRKEWDSKRKSYIDVEDREGD